MSLHIGDKPDPIERERASIAAHMGHLGCPACDWQGLAGSQMGAELLYSMHWRTEAEKDAENESPGARLMFAADAVLFPSQRDELFAAMHELRGDVDECITLLQSGHADEAERRLVRVFNDYLKDVPAQ